MGKPTPEEQAFYAAMLQQLGYIATHTSKTSEMLATGVRNGVLQTGSFVFDSTGVFTISMGSEIGSAEVSNGGDYSLVVASGTSPTAPIQGAGRHPMASGTWRMCNIANHSVSFYGTPGQSVSYQLFTQGGLWGRGQIMHDTSAIPVTLTGSNQQIATPTTTGPDVTGTLRYKGFALREFTGAASALVRIWDNVNTSSGNILDEVSLAPGESARELYPGRGVRATVGIYLQIVSGLVVGSVRYN